MTQNQPEAKLPLALVRDAIQVIVAAKHTDYSLKDVMAVVNALNQFAEAAVREYGSSLQAVDAPAESDTSQPPPA
jgi:hypothetical protein